MGDFGVGVQGFQSGLVHRVGGAFTPQAGLEVVQSLPGRFGHLVVETLVEGNQQVVQPAGEDLFGLAVEHVAHEHASGEVRRCGVGEGSRIGASVGQQAIDVRGRIGQQVAVVEHRRLGLVPGHFALVHRGAEVEGQGAVVHVHVLEAGKEVPIAAQQQAALLHGAEVLAVDPDHVHRSAGELAGLGLAEHGVDRVDGVGDPHLVEVDVEPRLELGADPLVHIGVNRGATTPHEPVDPSAGSGSHDLIP